MHKRRGGAHLEHQPADRRAARVRQRLQPTTAVRFVAQRLLLKPLVWSLTGVRVTGRARLRHLRGPFVMVANHSSHLDTPLLLGALPWRLARKVAVGAAADYFFDARWRAVLTAVVFNAFPVDRQGNRGISGRAAHLLEGGAALLVFPEGTRSRDGETAAFKPGAAALCLSRSVPCLPVGLRGTFDAMPRGRSWPARGRPPVTVAFGAPMSPEPGETPEDFTARVAAAVAALRADRGSIA